LLDGSYEKVTGKDGSEVLKYTPRTPEEMKGYEGIVKKAVGYNAERGDQVEVVNIPFQRIGVDEEEMGAWDHVNKQRFWSGLIRHGITILSLLLVFLFILRPMVRWLTARHGEPEIQRMLPQRAEDLEERIPRLASPEGSLSRQKLVELARVDTEKFARMVDAWLK